MPIYEYQCDACNHKFEILQKIADPLLTLCPACKQDKLRKMVTAAAFRLKGGGWYETDFKDKKTQKNIVGAGETTGTAGKDNKSGGAESSPGSTETKSPATDKTTTETKPAATSTTPSKSSTD